MKIKGDGFTVYSCELCGAAFSTDKDHERAITGIKKDSNGRHIVREFSRNTEKHICWKCVDSIRSEECNFHDGL